MPVDIQAFSQSTAGTFPAGFRLSGYVPSDRIPAAFPKIGHPARKPDSAIPSLVNLNSTNKWST